MQKVGVDELNVATACVLCRVTVYGFCINVLKLAKQMTIEGTRKEKALQRKNLLLVLLAFLQSALYPLIEPVTF